MPACSVEVREGRCEGRCEERCEGRKCADRCVGGVKQV